MTGRGKAEEPTEAEIDASWGLTPGMTPEARRELIRRYAEADEFEEDAAAAERAREELAVLREEQELVTLLGTRSFDTLPGAVRRLFRQNPNDPSIRALYDRMMRELYERTDDMMRGSLLPAVERMTELIDSDDEGVAFRASTYVFERLRGKTPEVVEHRQDKPFQVVLDRIVTGARSATAVRTDVAEEEGPVDAEIVSETLSAPDRPDRASQEVIKRRVRKLTAGTPAADKASPAADKPRAKPRRKTT